MKMKMRYQAFLVLNHLLKRISIILDFVSVVRGGSHDGVLVTFNEDSSVKKRRAHSRK